jgi:hypothetical protein
MHATRHVKVRGGFVDRHGAVHEMPIVGMAVFLAASSPLWKSRNRGLGIQQIEGRVPAPI